MQSDEEVGKISLATPILISKCLELFMQDLIENSCNITREKNSKTMSTNHLKACVKSTERFDFLADIVQNIPDIEPEPKRGRPGRKNITGVSEIVLGSEEAKPARGSGTKKRGRPKSVNKEAATHKAAAAAPPPPPVMSDITPSINAKSGGINFDMTAPLMPTLSALPKDISLSTPHTLPPLQLTESMNGAEENDDYDDYDE